MSHLSLSHLSIKSYVSTTQPSFVWWLLVVRCCGGTTGWRTPIPFTLTTLCIRKQLRTKCTSGEATALTVTPTQKWVYEELTSIGDHCWSCLFCSILHRLTLLTSDPFVFPPYQRQMVSSNEEADNPTFTENWEMSGQVERSASTLSYLRRPFVFLPHKAQS